MGEDPAGRGRLRLVLMYGTPTHVDASLADPYRPLLQVDVVPAQPRDFAAPQAGKSKMPCVPIAIVGDTAQDGLHLTGGERLELLRLARHPIHQRSYVSSQPSLGDQLRKDLRQSTEHVVAGTCTPLLARSTTGPDQLAATQLHEEIVDVSPRQILNGKLAELAAHRLQDVLIARGRRRTDLVARGQPVSALLLHREPGWLHVGARVELALYLRERRSSFLFGPVPTAQLFSPAVNDAGVDGQLIPNDRLAASAARQFNASDLWRQLAALSHLGKASRHGFGVGRDKPVNLRRGDPAGGPDLDHANSPASNSR
jgi:hypothetical protein